MRRLLPLQCSLFLIACSAVAGDLTTYRCSYPTYADDRGLHREKELFQLIYVVHPDGKATLVGNAGSAEVQVVANTLGVGVSFIEVTSAGNVMTTVVDKDGKSAHSRGTVIGGELRASQYYGTCTLQ